MPDPIRTGARNQAGATSAAAGTATVVVQAGDSLSRIAARVLGSPSRWRELYEANRDRIGDDPGRLRAGAVLVVPGGAAPGEAAPAAGPAKPARPAPPRPEPAAGGDVGGDRDGDGLADRYDAAPDDARDRRWNRQAAEAYAAFVKPRVEKLSMAGVEIDCADLAMKLLFDFCKLTGIPHPMGAVGERWQVYQPGSRALPNMKGPNHYLPAIGADNLAKGHTRAVNDANGNGIRGSDRRTGKVDVEDLMPGDILFYDWEGDGRVNHTVNVIDVAADGSVTLAFGSYDNLNDGPLTWAGLDLTPIETLVLKPGEPEYDRWFGENSAIWGARRFSWMPDKPRVEPRPVAPTAVEPRAPQG